MNTNDLRNRQVREILDEDINIYKQVIDRQFKSVKAYDEVVSEKKERDLEAEVSIEKIIQQLQLKLQREVQQAEYLLSASEQRWDERKNDKDIDNLYSHTGEILTLYNSAMRLYSKAGLSKDSQESIKIKLLQLNQPLNASLQALEAVIDFMFSNGYADNKLFWIFNTKSILETIKNQINGARFKIIDNSDIMATFKNLAGLQSQERITILKELMNTTTPLKIRTFFNYPLDDYDLMDKVQQLQAEMGVDLSKSKLRDIPIAKAQLLVDEAQKNIPLYKVASQRISEIEAEIEENKREFNDLEQAIIDARDIFDESKMRYDDFSRREKDLKQEARNAYLIYKQTEKLEQQFNNIQAKIIQFNKERRRRGLSDKEERAYTKLQQEGEKISALLDGNDSDIKLEEFNELKRQYGEVVEVLNEAKSVFDSAKNTKAELMNEAKLLTKKRDDLVKEYELILRQGQSLKRNVQGLEDDIGDVLQTNPINKRKVQPPPSFSEERFSKNDIYKFMVKNKALLIK